MTRSVQRIATGILFALAGAFAFCACGDDDASDPTASYCEAKCAYEATCDDGDASALDACEQACATNTDEMLASWNGVCVDEWLGSQECVYREDDGNGCDDTAARQACAAELDATSACYCSPMCTPNLPGNGSCDGVCNSAACDYDGGDC